MTKPALSLSWPPVAIVIVPLVMLSAPPLIVTLPLDPIASVWVLWTIEIGAAAVAVFSKLRTDGTGPPSIKNLGPLATVPVRCNVPPAPPPPGTPPATTEPVPLKFALTVPCPKIFPSLTPLASVKV